MTKKPKYVIEPVDGLRAECIGAWALEKHERLRKYVDICRAPRRKFNQQGMRSGSTYIDLYCGPGRAQVRSTGEFVDGGAVLAWRKSVEGGVPFSQVHIADLDSENVATCETRLRKLGCENLHTYVGPAEETVQQAVPHLNQHSLHLAYLDPYGLLPLPFSILQRLAMFKRMDMVIHVSRMDLQRNIRLYADDGRLEHFCPGWRESVDLTQKNLIARSALFEKWLQNLKGINGHRVVGIERVAGDDGKDYYWLVGVTRNDLGEKFWKEIRHVQPQGELSL